MLWVDYLILAIIVISVVVGFFRGFFPELLSIATWLVAVWAGWNYGESVLPMLAGKLGSPVVELWLARLAVFAVILILGGLVGQLVALVIEKSGLTGTDRTLGMVFGLVRGAAILGLLVIGAQMLEVTRESWWQESRLIPVGEQVGDVIRALLPDSIARHLQPPVQDGTEIPAATAVPADPV